MDIHRLQAGPSSAAISTTGAELHALRLAGHDLLWDAGPLWPRHAPLLFPIVGRLNGDTLRHRGRTFSMPRHGFARERDFTWIERSEATCTLELRDDAATRACYPFAFSLQVTWTLSATGLRMDLALHNPGPDPLPASLGLHPAFRWPLAPGLPKSAHRLVFAADEPSPLHRLTREGLLDPTPRTSPIQDRILPLRESLFTDDALVFDRPRSRALRFEAEGGPALDLRWEGFPHLGLWAKPDPGPAFLCLEPWEGHADPQGWTGAFSEKPGSFLLPPGAARRWALDMSVTAGPWESSFAAFPRTPTT